MSELEIVKLLNSAFGPVVGSIVAVLGLVYGGKIIKPQLAGSDATSAMINNLKEHNENQREQLEKLQKLYDETHALLMAQRENNALLRGQVMMMRMMLINKGVTEAELIAIGAVSPAESRDG